MDRITVIQEQIQMQEHNLLCYSKDYLCTEPKDNYVQEWHDTKERLEIFRQLLAETQQAKENAQ